MAGVANARYFDEAEKTVFDEEQAHLDKVESRIDAMVGQRRAKIKGLDERLDGWHAVDYDDADLRRALGRDRTRKVNEVDNLLSFKPAPYFCRFEVSIGGGEPRSYCVGERPLADLGDIVVLDWRSPLGHTYANKTQRQFKVISPESGHEYTYDLHLRRLVNIEDEQIKEITTEYDDASVVSLDGEIVDPFLLSVLRDKRRNFRLSGIIKTIQATQNSILERPINESFIVQGCAGSGKTMILLHRLSYLAFNHPEIDFSKYVVLTPSESFNAHIDDLCNQLELENVTRLTVESFYSRLVSHLSRADVRYEFDSKGRRGKAFPKIIASAEGLVSEGPLNEDYLRAVYSTAFLESVAERIMAHADDAYAGLYECGALDLFDSHGFAPLEADSSPYEAYRALVSRCDRLRKEASASVAVAEEKKAAYGNAASEYERALLSYQSAVDTLEPLRLKVMSIYPERTKADRQRLDTAREARKKLVEMLADAGKRREILAEETLRLEQELTAAQAELSSAEASGLLTEGVSPESNPEIAKRVAEACQAEADAVAHLKREYEKAGVFNLGKRRRIREELDRAMEKYEEARSLAIEQIVEEGIHEAEAEREARIERLSERVLGLSSSLAGGRERLSDVSLQFDQLSAKMDELIPVHEALEAFVRIVGPLVTEFEENQYPFFSKDLRVEALRRHAPEIAEYVEASRLLAASQRRSLEAGEAYVAVLASRVRRAQEDYLEAAAEIMSDAQEAALSWAEENCEQFDVRAFEGVVADALAELAGEMGVTLDSAAHYRHVLYTKAALCLFYYGPPAKGGACVCIDEAQDLSPAEHSLIRSSLGADAVVNLYGDTNQLVYPYKGISSWDDLDESGSMGRFVLQENYRNTVQVTDHCNKELDMNVTGVGLTGPEVERSALEDAAARLVALCSDNEGIRCAIIYAPEARSRLERESCLKDAVFEWDSVSVGSISVISVGASKGLEFDAVAVVEEGMTRNEKYVACTRAVELLLVVRNKDEVLVSDGSYDGDCGEIKSQVHPTTPIEPDAFHERAVPTTAYRSNAKCIRCGDKLTGPAYAGTVPISMDKTRYLCAKCHDSLVDIEVARADVQGAETAGSTYSITLIPEADNEKLRFALLDERTGGWYLTDVHEYTSPTFRNMKWHRKMAKIAEYCPKGVMRILVGDYEGNAIGEVDYSWSTSEEFLVFNADYVKEALRR